MRTRTTVLASLCVGLASGQTVQSVYNRDTHEPFHLKKVSVDSQVVGPMVLTSTWLDYENPYKSLTEATLNFEEPKTDALGGFAYLYGDEYVPGKLMDKNKAWFIYTAITSRNRDPGIMEQWSPTTYHCQIFPIKMGSDLRVRLWTVGLLEPNGETLGVPQPKVPMAVGYEHIDDTIAKPEWVVRSQNPQQITTRGDSRLVDIPTPVTAVAQKFKDGRVYVAGLFQEKNVDLASSSKIVVQSARYGTAYADEPSEDVTAKVSQLIGQGKLEIEASNSLFGDPEPNIYKRLHVKYTVNGKPMEQYTNEGETMRLFGGEPSFKGLHQLKTVNVAPNLVAFYGWVHKKNKKLTADYGGQKISFVPQQIGSGNATSRLWAQQMLASGRFDTTKEVLAFSMKYGVPSNATALLAVPAAEMKRYLEKEKAWQKAQAEQRRAERAEARRERNWAGQRNQNWSNSGGGDPEIRIDIPGARTVDALLPDKRVISLSRKGDMWDGNFEIPADVAEGAYEVKILAQMNDGSTQARTWTYNVDRTPPKGTAQLLREAGHIVLEVNSEAKLAEVAVYDASGQKWVLKETSPGVYRLELPVSPVGKLVVVLKDQAGNRAELNCSSPR